MKADRKVLGIRVGIVLLLFAMAAGVYAIDFGDILKVGGIVFVVDKFAPQLDKFINKLTVNTNVPADVGTKVVPIISLGKGGYIGAAQVMGPKDAVERVKAVAQLEGSFSGRTFRIKALIPVGSKELGGGIKRVQGVGISAIIDVHI